MSVARYAVADTLESVDEPQLKQTVMSLAQQLIAQGAAEGEARGEARGEVRGKALGEEKGRAAGKWIGKLQTLQEFLDEAVTPEETLKTLSIEELERCCRDCQARYDARFKRPS